MYDVEPSWQVADGFEPVRDLFTRGAPAFGRGGGAYCAYLDGRPVVDLWAGRARAGEPWRAGTTAVIMSATKGLSALCVQVLADRGRLDVDVPVAEVWPEFAQAGKGDVTIRQVLMHTAGLIGFPGQRDLLRFDGTGWDDHEAIAAGVAAAPLSWPAGTRHGYHAVTVGWLLGEIVRRVSGRSIGTFFAEEVAAPLGLEAWLGTPDGELHRVAQVHATDRSTLPRLFRGTYDGALAVMTDPNTLSGLAFLGGDGTSAIHHVETLFNNAKVLAAELPFGGATTTARALARLWSALALGGELDGVRLVSPESVVAWSRVVSRSPDALAAEIPMPKLLGPPAPVPRTLGYLGNGVLTPGLPMRFGPNPDAYGAEGLGGQYVFCDPANRISVGFVRSDLAAQDVFQMRLTRELYNCADRMGLLERRFPEPTGTRALVGKGLLAYLGGRSAARLPRRQVGGSPVTTSQGLLPHLRMLAAAQAAGSRLGLLPTAATAARRPAAERQLVKPARWMTALPPATVTSRDVVVPSRGGGVRVRLFTPAGLSGGGPALLYIHGGGFVVGGLDGAHWICAELAAHTGALVASVEYRIAPEDKFPAALEDCYDVLGWLAETRPGGVDGERIAVAGDSAGGNLTAALTLLVRDIGGPRLAHQTLIYPFLDSTISAASWRRWAVGGLDPAAGRMMMEHYAGDHPWDDPLVSPLHAPDLAGLPPALVLLAECDVLHDDGIAYAERLREAGVPTRLSVYSRMPHGFLSINRLCPPARPAVAEIAREICAALDVPARAAG